MAATLDKLSAFGPSFQIKVIASLLTRREFLVNISDSLSSEYFDNNSHKWIIDNILNYFSEFHTIPSMDSLKIETKKIDNEILKISILEQLKEAYRASDNSEDLPYIEKEFMEFCVNQQVKKAILQSVDLLKYGDYDTIKNLINKAANAGTERNIGHIYDKDLETRYRDDDRNPIPFPWKAFNKITDGGYGSGELILIFGPPKSGKSWTVIDMAAYAVMLGYDVVYYTLELSEAYIGRRIDAFLSGIQLDDLKDNKEGLDNMIKALKGKLIIKELPAGKATLNDIENHLDKLESQENFKPKAIFIDYLDLLSNTNKNRKDKIDDTDDIYVEARGIGRIRRVPIVSPSQINRAGANDEIITQDKIAGAFAKFFTADFAASLSRTRKDKINNTGRYHIMGNRMGPDGITFGAHINTSNGDIKINETPLDEDEMDFKDPKTITSGINKEEREHLSKFFKKIK